MIGNGRNHRAVVVVQVVVINRFNLRSLGVVGIVVTSIIGLASCSNDDVTQPSTSVATPTTTESTTATTTELTERVAMLTVQESVEFYPACGNEPLNHSGRTWYPIAHVGSDPMDASFQDRLDAVLEADREDPPVARMHSVARVVPPGPGDDMGTLIVWADGVARWMSDSGDLDVWMIDDELTYDWVC